MDVTYEILRKEHLPRMEAAISELGVEKARLAAFMALPHNMAFIARDGETIVGFLYGYTLLSLNANPQFFVYSVDVLEGYQNKGIGSKLFQYAVDHTRENGCSECFVITDKGNKRACRVYEKAGGKSHYDDEIVYVIEHSRNTPVQRRQSTHDQ